MDNSLYMYIWLCLTGFRVIRTSAVWNYMHIYGILGDEMSRQDSRSTAPLAPPSFFTRLERLLSPELYKPCIGNGGAQNPSPRNQRIVIPNPFIPSSIASSMSISNYGTTAPLATYTTHADNHDTSLWAKVRRVLLCSSPDTFEGTNSRDEELATLLEQPIRRGGKFMGIEIEWAEEKPKHRSHK